jgi:hypothetical protein
VCVLNNREGSVEDIRTYILVISRNLYGFCPEYCKGLMQIKLSSQEQSRFPIATGRVHETHLCFLRQLSECPFLCATTTMGQQRETTTTCEDDETSNYLLLCSTTNTVQSNTQYYNYYYECNTHLYRSLLTLNTSMLNC